MSLTEPTAWSAVTDDEAPADRSVRMPAESPERWSQLRSLSGGQANDVPDWTDDDRLDEMFSAWARAAVATDAVPGGFAADEDDRSRPVPAEPTEVRPTAVRPVPPGMKPIAGPSLEPDEAFDVKATATHRASVRDEPVTAWSRTDDDIIPERRRGRWGRHRG